MHKESYSTGNCVFPELPAGDITHVVSTVTITLDEYRELVKGKTIADALLSMIHDKKMGYSGISRDELEMLWALYGRRKEEK